MVQIVVPTKILTSRAYTLAFALLATLLNVQSTQAQTPQPSDLFTSRIVPILQQHCVRCHSAAEPNGDISFSNSGGWSEAGIVIAGAAADSRLIEVVSLDAEGHAEMPQDAPPLSDSQRQALATWIDAGAEWPEGFVITSPLVADLDWWSLKPIQAVPVQAITDSGANPVEALLDEQLASCGLKPTSPAPAHVLYRRLSYDLSGLPPTPEAVAAFVKAYAVDPELAWNDCVDELLAAPTFGEKWGQHWLDLARYAETHGYDKDKPRPNAWPYRDYVIRSLNNDKPYNQFVQEQIAGDILYPGSVDGVVALGFLAAGPWDFIGHVEVGEGKLDGRIAKHLDRDEMLSAVFNVFMSTTVQCAQCHHHKFDPVRMEDYYSAQAVFAGVDRANREYRTLSPVDQMAVDRLSAELRGAEADLAEFQSELNNQLDAQAAELNRALEQLLAERPIELPDAYGFHSQIEQQAETTKWVQVDLGSSMPIDRVRLVPAYDNFAGIGSGFGFPQRYQVAVSNDVAFEDGVRVLLDAVDDDQPNPRSSIIEMDASGTNAEPTTARFVRVTCSKLTERQSDFIVALAELEVLSAAGANLALGATATALDSIEALPRWGKQNLTDGIYWQRTWPTEKLTELVELERRKKSAEEIVFTPDVTQQLRVLRERITSLQTELKQFPPANLVFAAASEFSPEGQFKPTTGRVRPIHLLRRGDLGSPGERMWPGAPKLWEPAECSFAADDGAQTASRDNAVWDEAAARAGLARYTTDTHNPLFWRSIANRVWLWTFGQPLVGTPNDFGRMGLEPTHPELLDYLAARLRDDPQHSLKSLVRLLVTSRAYSRSSENIELNLRIDAGNQFYWRTNRRKLTAEEFRDALLSVSALLPAKDVGGPSFQDFVVEKPEHSPHYEYGLADPNNPATFRRSIYRFIVRSQPQPMLTVLDCADPSISVPQRDESTTALQALTQWNDALVEAMAIHFADRLRQDCADEVEAKTLAIVQRAGELALGRLPLPEEEELLVELCDQHGAEVLARVLFNTSAFNYVD